MTLTGSEVVLDEATLDSFRAGLRGELLTTDAADYDPARAVWNAMIDKRPALIVRCRGAADVISAVNFARGHGLLLSVRGGGHSVAGTALCDGGLTIDLSSMRGIRVDPVGRTARAEPGLTWKELDHETLAFGLATTGGTVSSTGIAGLTLGGGVGWLMPKYGLALDNLRSAEMVMADGRVLRASDDENADLFWAIRGGGGNFGIAASLEYELHSVGPTIFGGLVAHPAQKGKEILTFFRNFAASVPDEVMVMAALLPAPDGSGAKLAGIAGLSLREPRRGRGLARYSQDVYPSGHGLARSDQLLQPQLNARCLLSEGGAQLLEVALSSRIERRLHRHVS